MSPKPHRLDSFKLLLRLEVTGPVSRNSVVPAVTSPAEALSDQKVGQLGEVAEDSCMWALGQRQ